MEALYADKVGEHNSGIVETQRLVKIAGQKILLNHGLIRPFLLLLELAGLESGSYSYCTAEPTSRDEPASSLAAENGHLHWMTPEYRTAVLEPARNILMVAMRINGERFVSFYLDATDRKQLQGKEL